LQEAARAAGRDDIHAIKAATTAAKTTRGTA
jgi:hypothetical protein